MYFPSILVYLLSSQKVKLIFQGPKAFQEEARDGGITNEHVLCNTVFAPFPLDFILFRNYLKKSHYEQIEYWAKNQVHKVQL